MITFNIQGYRILVEVEAVKETTDWGFEVVHTESQKRMENSGQQTGRVLGIGSTCWTDAAGKQMTEWCKVGDLILFSKHAARFIYTPGEDKIAASELAVINDTDVIAVVNEKEENDNA